MHSKFVSCDRATPIMFPASMDDWLPQDHLARFVVDTTERLDVRHLEAAYRGCGVKAYHPRMLLGLLFYAYATGVFSSRRMEQATYDSIPFRYVTADKHPDHDTIATFRRRFLKELPGLFLQILVIAAKARVHKVGTVSIDGSKVKANASKHSALSWGYISKLEPQLKAEVAELLRKGGEADTSEAEVRVTAELAHREARAAVIDEAKRDIEARAQARYEREKGGYDKKMVAREAREAATGKKIAARKPKAPTPGPRARDQINLTDASSRIMPVTGGGFEQAFNVQVAVDQESMLIVGQHVGQAPNDKQELKRALDELDKVPEQVLSLKQVVADNGYFSTANIEMVEERQCEPLIAMGRTRHNPPLKEQMAAAPPLPETTTAVERMAHRLQTTDGKAVYARRTCTVEPAKGIIKSVMGFRQFMLRGFEQVQGEWTLVSIAWNLKRMAKLQAIHA